MSHPSLRMGFVSTRLAGTDGDRDDLKSLRPWWPHYGKRANVLLPNAARTRRKDSHFPFHPPILACRSRNHAVAAAAVEMRLSYKNDGRARRTGQFNRFRLHFSGLVCFGQTT